MQDVTGDQCESCGNVLNPTELTKLQVQAHCWLLWTATAMHILIGHNHDTQPCRMQEETSVIAVATC